MVAVGTGRVTSQTEMATDWVSRTSCRSGRRVYWVAERVKDGGFGVGEGGGVVGLNDRRSVGGEVDGQALGPVGQFNKHWDGLSLPCVTPSYVILTCYHRGEHVE